MRNLVVSILMVFGSRLTSASPTFAPSAPANLVPVASALFAKAKNAQKPDASPAQINEVLMEFGDFHSKAQMQMNNDKIENLGPVLRAYFNLSVPIVNVMLLNQPSTAWDLNKISASFELSIPKNIAIETVVTNQLPAEMVMVRQDANEIIYSVRPSLIIGAGMKQLVRHFDNNDKNYEMLVRCLLGAGFGGKYANAFLNSRGGANTNLESRLSELKNKPFCMNETLPHYIQTNIAQQFSIMQNQMARLVVMSNLPDHHTLRPPAVLENKDKKFRMGESVSDLAENWGQLALAPEDLTERTDTDDKSVLSLKDAKPIVDSLKDLNASYLKGDEAIFSAFDPELLADLKKLAESTKIKSKVDYKELERRIRLGQIIYLQSAIKSPMELFSMVGAKQDLASSMFSQMNQILFRTISASLVGTLGDVVPAMMPELPPGFEIPPQIAGNAAVRHVQRLQSNTNYVNFVNKLASRIQTMTSLETLLDGQAKGLTQQMRDVAIKMNEATGPQVKDEQLKYVPGFVLQMLTAEIKASSPRVQSWMEYVKNSGGYTNWVNAQIQVEAHVKKEVLNPEACEIHPITWGNTGYDLYKSFKQSIFGYKTPPSITNESDCARFVRLTTYADVRGGKEMPKDMSGVVKAMDTYWNDKDRKKLLAFYRQLLRLESLEQFRVLDLVIADKKSLGDVLATADGSADIMTAVSKVMENLELNMKALVGSKNLDELGPIIARSSFLDSAFAGLPSIIRGSNGDNSESLAAAIGLKELANRHKLVEFSDLKAPLDTSSDFFLSASRIHGMKKDKYKVLADADRGQWDYVYRRSLDAIFPIMGIVSARRVFSLTPSFFLTNWLKEYVAVNASVAQGYFSFLTVAFAGDGFYQWYTGVPGLNKLEQDDATLAYTEVEKDNNSPNVLSPFDQLKQKMDIQALREDAESREYWAVAFTLLPILPSIVGSKTVARALEGPMNVRWSKREWEYAKRKAADVKNGTNHWERTVNTLRYKARKRITRLAGYFSLDLRKMGLNPEADAMEVMNLETLQKAMKAIEDAGDKAATEVAKDSYRRILTALYNEVAAYESTTPFFRELYSELYSVKGKITYIPDIIKEYESVVLGR